MAEHICPPGLHTHSIEELRRMSGREPGAVKPLRAKRARKARKPRAAKTASKARNSEIVKADTSDTRKRRGGSRIVRLLKDSKTETPDSGLTGWRAKLKAKAAK